MRKRSAYKPRAVRLDVMHWIKGGMATMAGNAAALDLRIKNHSCLKAITDGRANRDDLDVMIAALNITEALASQNQALGSDWSAEVKAAQDAFLTMVQRGIHRDDCFIFTGAELTAVNLAMEIHDAQIDKCTVAQLEQALDLVKKQIRSGKARRIDEGVL
jgi:hypothetical protein